MAFIVKVAELNTAAQDYSSAATNYDTHSTALLNAMNITDANWSDEAGNQWRAITDKATQELTKIKGNLDSNSKLLSEVASKAAATQEKVTAGIGGIY